MIRNYILIALRNLWRHRLITLINLIGMTVGFGIFLSFWSWVRYEWSFDRFHEHIDQMYVLNVTIRMEDSEYTSERSGGIFATALPDQFPQLLTGCRISQAQEFELGVVVDEGTGDPQWQYFNENLVLGVDSTFMHIFSFDLVKGSKELIFTERDHMVITKSLAHRLFGDEDPMFKTVRLGDHGYYKVAGVVKDPPEVSSFQFNALVDIQIMRELDYPLEEPGGNIYYNVYRIAEGTDLVALNKSINTYISSNFDLELESRFFLDRFSRMHLHGETKGIAGLYINLIMALVMLSIACINFINLTTAYASTRMKEIAIRKSVGASKRQLVFQFLGETYLLLLVAFYLGFTLAEQLIPILGRAFGTNHSFNFSGISFIMQMAILFIVTGLLAGLYPAVKISGFQPLAFISGKESGVPKKGSRSRKTLIVVQFSFSVIFILVTVFMTRQYVHLKEADLGFNREDVLYVKTSGQVWEKYPVIKKELAGLHYVEEVTSGSAIPVMLSNGTIDWGERDGEHNKLAVTLWTDPDFISTFEIGMLQGEYFTHSRDSLNYEYVVVNQVLVDLLGWDDPVGRKFYMWGRDYTILGVTDNIDFFPFNLGIFEDKALIYRYDPVSNYVFIRMNPDRSPEQIAQIEAVFRKHNPGYEVIYDFLSNYEYSALQSGQGVRFVFILFSVLAILVAAMGLIGLSVFNNNSRTKEVGIRKAVGAHTGIIMSLLLSDFMKLVALSNLIAMPAAYLILRLLLQIFSYRVELKASVFVVVFFLSVITSMITVIYHAFRTARSNPVNSLRYE
jgi:ABC-type antimicrobial peptide transport system permease subunit